MIDTTDKTVLMLRLVLSGIGWEQWAHMEEAELVKLGKAGRDLMMGRVTEDVRDVAKHIPIGSVPEDLVKDLYGFVHGK